MAIAIMACRKLVGKCSGTGCFDAYNESKDAFLIYKENNPKLSSFFYCSGCNETISDDEDWNHKIKQLKNKDIDTIHLALCMEVECNNYSKHEKLLEREGFKVIKGTHR
ncbi:CGGC domain-containing protein [Romboutsia weinsteinii]|uniref:CGGC domain-containing protein n=1 Tax=Romboutsia weinsteinii TaxID=2020949 RepID=A0A371J989_9FIRM|nr:CGGC domain-containing protein [Romboutsia weinsteinii]RDY29321.1 CGGC domain-containing protein [Romboutsia weinsteinii]